MNAAEVNAALIAQFKVIKDGMADLDPAQLVDLASNLNKRWKDLQLLSDAYKQYGARNLADGEQAVGDIWALRLNMTDETKFRKADLMADHPALVEAYTDRTYGTRRSITFGQI